jgi:hypothetical protein
VKTSVGANAGKVLRFAALGVVILFGLASILATGGGGGGGGGSSSSAGSGSVALLMGDGPADDYDHIYVYVTKVSLIPAYGTSPGPVVIFESSSPAGHKVDLLAYRDEDFLLGIKHNVPAGRYEKIRLEVASIEAEGGPCELELIKLPSGKIDLNPRGGFEVRSGESLAIRLDMDANKSINLHEAGSSGKCIFRPVVFVDIKPGTFLQRCPVNITGTITDLLDQDKDRTVDGFILDLTGARGPLTVLLEPDAPIFDANGLPATPAALAKGQQAWTRGRLDAQGRFRARAVVIGQVLTVDGVAQSPVVRPANTFPFLPDVGEALVGQTDVKLYLDKSLVFRGCDAPAGWDAIDQEVPARVFGKFSTVEPELRAAVVLLRNIEVSGEVVAFADSASPEGRDLTIRTSSGDKIVFVPKDTPIFLEGDGQVPLDLVCTGTTVRVHLDPDATQPTAADVKVVANLLEGTVTGVSGGNTLLVLPTGQTVATRVHVRDGATIIDQRDDSYKLLNFADIKVTDQLKVFGLKASPCNTLFEAFVVLVVGP